MSQRRSSVCKEFDFPELDQLDMLPASSVSKVDVHSLQRQFRVSVTDSDIEAKASRLPAVTHVAGYCAHAALKKLTCTACRENLVLQDVDLDNAENALIANMSRGGLKFPRAAVVNAVLFTEIALDRLRAPEHSTQFFSLPRQKDALVGLVFSFLGDVEDLDTCDFGHTAEEVMELVMSAAANTVEQFVPQRK